MKDSELLELAAKAAGYELQDHTVSGDGLWLYGDGKSRGDDGRSIFFWSPLNDDGDAFRLASSLDICLRLMGDEITGIAHWHKNGKTSRVVGNYHTGNSGEARRLVVRAAAEIGKSIL